MTATNPLSRENIARATEEGRKIREQREAMRAALDNKGGGAAPPDENGWVFANENGVVTALALGPVVLSRFA